MGGLKFWIFAKKPTQTFFSFNREKLCLLEKQFLEQKHQLERSMETALWELEEAQLAEKHALLTQQFRVGALFLKFDF